jgi:hypothetical protein
MVHDEAFKFHLAISVEAEQQPVHLSTSPKKGDAHLLHPKSKQYYSAAMNFLEYSRMHRREPTMQTIHVLMAALLNSGMPRKRRCLQEYNYCAKAYIGRNLMCLLLGCILQNR